MKKRRREKKLETGKTTYFYQYHVLFGSSVPTLDPVQDLNLRLDIQTKLQIWWPIKKESYFFSYLLTKLSKEPKKPGRIFRK